MVLCVFYGVVLIMGWHRDKKLIGLATVERNLKLHWPTGYLTGCYHVSLILLICSPTMVQYWWPRIEATTTLIETVAGFLPGFQFFPSRRCCCFRLRCWWRRNANYVLHCAKFHWPEENPKRWAPANWCTPLQNPKNKTYATFFFFFFKKNPLPSLPAVARKTEGKVNWFMSAAVWMNISVDSAPRRVCYGLGMRSVSGRKRNCKQRTAAVAGRDGGNGRSVRRIALCAVRRFRFCRPARPIPPRKPLDRVARMKWATKEARKRLGNGRFLVFRTRRLNLFKTSDNLIITQFLTKNRGSAETCEKWSTKTMM